MEIIRSWEWESLSRSSYHSQSPGPVRMSKCTGLPRPGGLCDLSCDLHGRLAGRVILFIQIFHNVRFI